MIDAVGVTLKDGGQTYYFDPLSFELNIKDSVIVETEKGLQFGYVVMAKQSIKAKDFMLPLKKVIRIATEEDKIQNQKNVEDSGHALEDARHFAKNLGLAMTFIDAMFTFDRNQLLLFFLADGRIDFRELAKKLAQVYRTRIELRQIGVRDKSKIVGGLGPCGRFLCCNAFLTDFDSVSINMAKNQFLALNPSKINGLCGRLLCCLNYEDETYTELKKNMPEIGNMVETEEGLGRVIATNIFTREYKVEVRDKGQITLKVKE